MVLDRIENLDAYLPALPALARVREYLAASGGMLPDGGAELGSGVRVNVAENALAQTGRYEAHRRFIDLQLVLEGSEAMEWAPLDELSGGGYDEARDIEFFEGEPAGGVSLGLTAGMFAIFYPQDAHKPGLRHRHDRARKAVFKIPV